MKSRLAVIIASLAVLTAQDLEQDNDFDTKEKDVPSLEDVVKHYVDYGESGAAPFNLKGTLRKSFALDVALSKPGRSVVCSPISALLPLGKLVLGTERGKSREELLKAIGYRKTKVKKNLRAVIKHLKYLPGVTLDVASYLYVSKDTHLLKKYHADTVSVFKTDVQRLDFTKPEHAAGVINKMVSENTNGHITNIISPPELSTSTSLIIINAIYFAGRWKYPFNNVTTEYFHSPVGAQKLPMMTRVGYYNYKKSKALGAQIIEIPYEGEKASFVIVLPLAENGLMLLLRQLKVAPGLLNNAVGKMEEFKVTLTIPKFKIESELNLNEFYDKIGVKHIFSREKSGLTRISNDNPLWVSKAKQKVYIEVTERGSVAAAVTDNQLVPVVGHERIVFNANRPFLFFIRTEKEQLFAGKFSGSSMWKQE